MKKILLLISFVILSLATYALNPFAYALSSELSADQSTLTVKYKLNATATSVQVEIYNGQTKVKTVNGTTTVGDADAKINTVSISTNDLPKGTNLTWKVVVNGESELNPTLHGTTYAFYHPSAVDIDNNPENETFGLILTNEAMQEITSLTAGEKGAAGISYSEYRSYTLGAGVYAFNPAFEPIDNGKKPGFNGGNLFTQYRKHNSTTSGNPKVTAYAPRRIRISKDGRIFVTSLNTNGDVLWEIDPTNLDSWTPVFQGLTQGQYQDLYNGSTFVAGPNAGFDVRGSGKDLKLLMLSANTLTDQLAQRGFRISEYHLGENTEWSEAPSKTFPHDNTYNSTQQYYQCYFIVPTQSQVQYDKDGGVWYISFTTKSSNSQPGLVHFTANGEQDYKKNWNNVRNGGFRFNHDFSKVIIAGNNVNGSSGETKKATVYSVSKDANGAPVLSDGVVIDMSTLGNNLNDFAWDYAGNLYGVSNSNEKIAAWAMPYSGTVSTPAASKYAFSLGQLNPFAYALSSTLSNDQKTLTVNYSLNANATSVNIQIVDGEEVVRTISSAGTTKGAHTLNVSTEGFPAYTYLSWQVEVNGNSVAEPTELATSYSFYHPSSVDIDNNPENENFGLILTNEAMQKVKGLSGYSLYMSYITGAGIYAFTPSFEPIENGSTYGFNGGKEFVRDNTYGVLNEEDNVSSAYTPRRIRISDDGRIFITSLNPTMYANNPNNAYLWEVNPKNLNEWSPVFQGQGVTVNSNAELTINGDFVAAPNTGFDVKGSGEDLQLLMLSSDVRGMGKNAVVGGFKCSEYNLGSATTWSQIPSRDINIKNYVINYRGSQVQYDNEGGFWLCQFRVSATENTPSLVYFNANGEEVYKEVFNNRNSGAFRFNHDFSKVVIAGDKTGTNKSKKASIYAVSKDANGVPVLTFEREIDMTTIGYEINDFAFDYAGNLYACGNANEKLAVWAMPYDGQVITPAASKNVFQLTPAIDNANLLNPYAYNLYRTEENGYTKLHFFLNTHAKRVQVILMDQNKNEYVLRDYPTDASPSVPYHPNGYATVITDDDIARLIDLGLPIGEPITWKVEVDGFETRTEPILTTNAVPFFAPNSVAIDKDVESPYFGRVLVVEAGHARTGDYYSSPEGVVQGGIYAFKPELVNVNAKIASYMPWDVNYERIPYTGNKDFTKQIVTGSDNNSGYQPWMVRISEDGRIFVSSADARTDGTVVWEVDPANLNSWSDLITGTLVPYTGLAETTDGVYYVKNANENFLAGVNCSMDVKGSGENLELLLYSTDRRGMLYSAVRNYQLHKYAVGQQARFTGTPTRIDHFGNTRYGHVSYHAKVTYDEDRGFWFGGDNTGGTGTDIIFANAYKTASGDYERKTWEDNADTYSGGSGVCTHIINGEKILFKGIENNQVAFYKVSYKSTGEPTLHTKGWGLKLSANKTCRCNDFAVDYAHNLYLVDGHNKKLMTVALPYSGSITTPAAERYSFTVGDPVPCIVAYNLSCTPNLNSRTYNFAFCANMPATEGKISFHKNDGSETLLAEYAINQQITQGTNIVSYEMDEIDKMLNGEKDIIWKLHLRAESSVFGEIYKSEQLNTAYATIDASPTSDFFGQIYAANQEDHTFSNKDKAGEIKVWTPNGAEGNIYREKSTITKPLGSTGLELPYRPGVAPDGTVYFTDGGTNGNVYMMNPNDNTVKSFYTGYTQKVGQDAGKWSLFYDGSNQVVGAPSSSAHVYWDNSGVKLFTTRSEIYTATVGNNNTNLLRHNNGYFIYNLDQTTGVGQHAWTGTPKAVPVTEDNIYSTLFTVVGTSHGAWLCQHRRKGKDMSESRSLMFYGNDGTRKYVSNNADIINGTPGSGLAMSKDEKTLAMTSGDAGIMLFDITWNGDVPTLTHRQTFSILNNGFITSLNFDYAGNLVATIGDTYNDSSDEHRMVVYALPKADNSIVIPTRYSQRMPALFADERVDVALESGLQSNYQTVDVYRPLVAGMCNTICLPFAIADKAGTPYENAKIFSFVGVVEGNDQLELQFTEVTSMQAGVPYLIQPESDITDIVRFTNVAPMVGTEPSSVQLSNGVTFHGTINPKDLAVDANYLFLVANNRLATASEGGEMLGLRGYFTVNGTLPSKAIISFREGTATGVTSTIGQTDSVQKILQNQQILIIKGGKTYNVLGTHVK